jgi:hypothetical protein
MTRIDEIAANIFRISTYFSDFNLQFSQFLIRDDEPLLFETGMKQMFPMVRDAVARSSTRHRSGMSASAITSRTNAVP